MSKFGVFLVALLLLSTSTLSLGHGATSAGNNWVSRAAMPTARTALGVAVVNGKIYAIGGYNSGYLRTNEEYDPLTDSWTTKTPMPTAISSFGIAVCQNKIYVIGGATGFPLAEFLADSNEVYDPATDSWQTKTKMPFATEMFQANVVDNKIYIFSGLGSNGTQVYDPATDSWATKTPIPTAVYDYASAVVDKRIYIIGGVGPNLPNLNQIYNPLTDSWTKGSPVPSPISGATAGATTNEFVPTRIFVVGGRVDYGSNSSDITQVFDPISASWSVGASMPTSRFDLAVAVVNDTLFALGGISVEGHSTAPYAVNEQYFPIGYGTIPSASPTVLPTQTPLPNSGLQFWALILVAASVVVVIVVVALVLAKRRQGSPMGPLTGKDKSQIRLLLCGAARS